MSLYVYPTLPNIAAEIEWEEIGGKTLVYENPGGTEQRVGLQSIPRRRYTQRYPVLRDNVAAPAPWSPYSELGVVLWFLKQHRGAGDSFLFDEPTLRRNLLTYSQDFSQAAWGGYFVKPGITTGILAPDGTLTATRFASADSGPYFSGLTQANLVAPTGPIAVSIWARAFSGTLAASFGTIDSDVGAITLTTSWQRFTRTDAAWSPGDQMGRIFTLYEAVQANQAWEVWGAQAEPYSAPRLYVPTEGAPAGAQVRVRFDSDSLVVKRLNSEWYAVEFDLASVAA